MTSFSLVSMVVIQRPHVSTSASLPTVSPAVMTIVGGGALKMQDLN